jgi:VWFA-related protein
MKEILRRAAIAAVVACMLAVTGGYPVAARGQNPTFRASVDLIPVDVQVVDSDGKPVPGLEASQFEVTIDGHKRAVVSADLIDLRPRATVASLTPATPGPSPAPASPALPPSRRVMILAVDSSSFDQQTARPILASAAHFIEQLPADDEVGLFTFPLGPKVDPTTDHGVVVRALDGIIARRDDPPPGEFNLSPSDLVELSTWVAHRPTRQAEELYAKLCAPDDAGCGFRLDAEVTGGLLLYEGRADSSIGTLRSLMFELGKVPFRKTVVLVSGGLVSSDLVGGRPDIHDIGEQVGKDAAAADVNVYALFVDGGLRQQMSAEVGRIRNSFVDLARDGTLHGRWLDQFAGSSGGSFIRLTTTNADPAFQQILTQTSAYYLLGVEPTLADRDGRPHDLKVRVRDRKVTVRGRSWVVVRKPGAAEATAAARPAAPTVTAGPVLPVAPVVRALAQAFDRDDRAAIATAMSARDADAVIRAFRDGGSPWPASPRRTATFALDLAIAGLRVPSSFTQREALRLLAEYTARVTQPATDDPFECRWLRTQSAGLEGLLAPSASLLLVSRSNERCPSDPRQRLALAIVRDQQIFVSQDDPAAPRVPDAVLADEVERVLGAYQDAAASPETMFEARIRAAWLCFRAGRYPDGLARLDFPSTAPPDPQVRYIGQVVRGQLLRAADRPEEAAAAFREALVTWPNAQTARVALMTLLVSQGQPDQAAALADQIRTAPSSTTDPWWLYWMGDYRSYLDWRAELREVSP